MGITFRYIHDGRIDIGLLQNKVIYNKHALLNMYIMLLHGSPIKRVLFTASYLQGAWLIADRGPAAGVTICHGACDECICGLRGLYTVCTLLLGWLWSFSCCIWDTYAWGLCMIAGLLQFWIIQTWLLFGFLCLGCYQPGDPGNRKLAWVWWGRVLLLVQTYTDACWLPIRLQVGVGK